MYPATRTFESFRRNGPLVRAFVTVVLGLLLLSEPLRLLHLVLVEHGVCAEHGEIIHIDGTAGERAGVRVASEAVQVGEAGAHEHEHCAIGCFRRDLATVERASTGDIEPSHGAALEAPPLERIESSRSALSYAPKQSPPCA